MDIYDVSVKIGNLVSKSLTPEFVGVLKADGSIGTIKIISRAFEGLSITKRLQQTMAAINDGDSSILKQFDLSFILVTHSENLEWTDYAELNQNSRDDDYKITAKEL